MYNSILCLVRPAGARYRFCIFRKEYTTMKQFTKIAVVCALAVSLAACGSFFYRRFFCCLFRGCFQRCCFF